MALLPAVLGGVAKFALGKILKRPAPPTAPAPPPGAPAVVATPRVPTAGGRRRRTRRGKLTIRSRDLVQLQMLQAATGKNSPAAQLAALKLLGGR